MRTLAISLAAVLGLALPAAADSTRMQLAQAGQGAQSGAGGTAQQSEGAARGQRGGENAGATGTTQQRTEGRRDGAESRTNVRANVRIGGGGREDVRSRVSTTRRIGVR